jgi:hypothetical protein
MRRIHVVTGLALVLIAAAAAWYFISPGLTVQAMVQAAEGNDEARFSSYVDYPALREDMKAELTARLQEEARRDGSAEAKVGLAMGMALMNPLVDSMVSPQGMKTAFANLAKEEAATKKGETSGGKAAEGGKPRPEIRRLGFNSFIVTGKDTPGSGLVFERRGLSWKLAGIDLQPSRAQDTLG